MSDYEDAGPMIAKKAPDSTVHIANMTYRALESARTQLQPVLKEAPKPVQDVFKDPKAVAPILNALLNNNMPAAVALSLDASKLSMRDRPAAEAAALDFFQKNQVQFATVWSQAQDNVAAQAYVDTNKREERRGYMSEARKREEELRQLGIPTTGGQFIRTVAEYGQKKNEDWLNRNGRELFQIASEAGYTRDTVLSTARYLDSIYQTSLAAQFANPFRGPSPEQTAQQALIFQNFQPIEQIEAIQALVQETWEEILEERENEGTRSSSPSEERIDPKLARETERAHDAEDLLKSNGINVDTLVRSDGFQQAFQENSQHELAEAYRAAVPVRIIKDGAKIQAGQAEPKEALSRLDPVGQAIFVRAYRVTLEQQGKREE